MSTYLAPGVYVEEVPSAVRPIAGVGTSTAGFIGVAGKAEAETNDKAGNSDIQSTAVTPILCTNFTQYEKTFGSFKDHSENRNLIHAVYGFFNNGGTRCWVAPVSSLGKSEVDEALKAFAAIDEIALVAAPGAQETAVLKSIYEHCADSSLQDRFAILDGQKDAAALTTAAITAPSANSDSDTSGEDNADAGEASGLGTSDYAALYYPWIEVYDPVAEGTTAVPPSGHIAGIYARVDAQRGVHKAPANEVIRGALGVGRRLSRAEQAGLNPEGINVIRVFNGNITVWGARTLGGDANSEWKYVPVRRLFNFLRESIDEGTQWVVFEPNTPELWAKIRRNVSAFLQTVWASGALFGNTPEEAFYVRCDETTNPQEIRDQGQVVTEIGVAVVKPAEFVVFRISQWAGPGQ